MTKTVRAALGWHHWLEVGRFPGIRISIPTFPKECDTASEIGLYLLESSK